MLPDDPLVPDDPLLELDELTLPDVPLLPDELELDVSLGGVSLFGVEFVQATIATTDERTATTIEIRIVVVSFDETVAR